MPHMVNDPLGDTLATMAQRRTRLHWRTKEQTNNARRACMCVVGLRVVNASFSLRGVAKGSNNRRIGLDKPFWRGAVGLKSSAGGPAILGILHLRWGSV